MNPQCLVLHNKLIDYHNKVIVRLYIVY